MLEHKTHLNSKYFEMWKMFNVSCILGLPNNTEEYRLKQCPQNYEEKLFPTNNSIVSRTTNQMWE